jgi:hypothetical protein
LSSGPQACEAGPLLFEPLCQPHVVFLSHSFYFYQMKLP